VLPTGAFAPRAVPSFHRVGPGGVKALDVNRLMETAGVVMRRRGRELVPPLEAIYRGAARAGAPAADAPPITLQLRKSA
jgi:hypothetical protein